MCADRKLRQRKYYRRAACVRSPHKAYSPVTYAVYLHRYRPSRRDVIAVLIGDYVSVCPAGARCRRSYVIFGRYECACASHLYRPRGMNG